MRQRVIKTPTGWMIKCRTCQWHEFPLNGKPGASWTFNGDFINPTFTPSMNEAVNWPTSPHYNPEMAKYTRRCHFIITDGKINYCGDCTHELKNQSFELEEFDQAQIAYYKLGDQHAS